VQAAIARGSCDNVMCVVVLLRPYAERVCAGVSVSAGQGQGQGQTDRQGPGTGTGTAH